MPPSRGDVYYVNLQGVGMKLGAVVSWDSINRGMRQPIIARITRRERERSLPTYVELQPGEGGVRETSYVLCHELLTLREDDFTERLGILPLGRLLQVEAALKRALDLG